MAGFIPSAGAKFYNYVMRVTRTLCVGYFLHSLYGKQFFIHLRWKTVFFFFFFWNSFLFLWHCYNTRQPHLLVFADKTQQLTIIVTFEKAAVDSCLLF